MTARGGAAVALGACLSAAALTACGTASTSEQSWLYIGPDPSLRAPPMSITPRLRDEIAAERRDDPNAVLSPGLQARLPEEFATWRGRVLTRMEAARGVCRQATGDPGTRHFWSGYDAAFLDCMKAQGWSRPTGTNPL